MDNLIARVYKVVENIDKKEGEVLLTEVNELIEKKRSTYLKAFYPLLAKGDFSGHELANTSAESILSTHRAQFTRNLSNTLSIIENSVALNRIDFVSCIIYPLADLFADQVHQRSRFNAIKNEFEAEENRKQLNEEWKTLFSLKRKLLATLV
ncbi:MAG: hypothetical protein IPH62_15095 [Ignavibacteriae bacterium]|nr:hypothetical protein [Ignavibacteriota bacterium]